MRAITKIVIYLLAIAIFVLVVLAFWFVFVNFHYRYGFNGSLSYMLRIMDSWRQAVVGFFARLFRRL